MKKFPDAIVLGVDLSTGQISREIIPGEVYRLYPGGSSLAAYIALHSIPPGIDPLSPENVLVFAVSPLTGLPVAGLNRVAVAAKSPLTDAIGDSQAGGGLPVELKNNGFDAVVFRGRSPEPVYLYINGGDAELRSASHLWGLPTGDADDAIRREFGGESCDSLEIAQIGPGGENMVRFACIVHNCSRANGRTGNGAVMGSKNLKAMVVARAARAKSYNSEGIEKINATLIRRLGDPFWRDFSRHGTTGNVEPLRDLGYLPTENFQRGRPGETPDSDDYRVLKGGRAGCDLCPIACKRVAEVEGRVDPRYGGPEFQTIAALGTNCGVTSIDDVCEANQLCNMYGLDTISCGATIAFAMECAKRGLLGPNETGGLDLSFGGGEAVCHLVEMIAKRKGIGDLLAEGSHRAAETIGGEARDCVMASKKQELPASMPQFKPSLGLIYAVNPFGADHQSSEHDTMLNLSPDSPARQWLARLGVDPNYTPAPNGDLKELDEFTVRFAFLTQCFYSTLDTLCMCQFVWGPSWQVLGPDDIVDLCRSEIGWDVSLEELMRIGERRINMMRAFNAREGFTGKDDALPKRFFKPLAEGSSSYLDKDSFERAKKIYYRLAGWNEATGNPTREKLEDLSLGWLDG